MTHYLTMTYSYKLSLASHGKYERSQSFKVRFDTRNLEKPYECAASLALAAGVPWRESVLSKNEGACPSLQHRSGSVAPHAHFERFFAYARLVGFKPPLSAHTAVK